MSSTFFGLNIAYSGLLSSNASLNTTANNIANVQTEGYSRQEVKTQAAQAIRTFATYGCAGAGVDTLAVERMRDEFYDAKFWNNNAKVGEFNMKAYYGRGWAASAVAGWKIKKQRVHLRASLTDSTRGTRLEFHSQYSVEF